MGKSYSTPPKFKDNTRMPTLLFKIVLETLARALRQEKETERIHIRKKEVNLSLFAGDMILYVVYSKDYIQTIINSFSKVAGYKISM